MKRLFVEVVNENGYIQSGILAVAKQCGFAGSRFRWTETLVNREGLFEHVVGLDSNPNRRVRLTFSCVVGRGSRFTILPNCH